jgi:hypothetical protein
MASAEGAVLPSTVPLGDEGAFFINYIPAGTEPGKEPGFRAALGARAPNLQFRDAFRPTQKAKERPVIASRGIGTRFIAMVESDAHQVYKWAWCGCSFRRHVKHLFSRWLPCTATCAVSDRDFHGGEMALMAGFVIEDLKDRGATIPANISLCAIKRHRNISLVTR